MIIKMNDNNYAWSYVIIDSNTSLLSDETKGKVYFHDKKIIFSRPPAKLHRIDSFQVVSIKTCVSHF